MTDTAVYVRWSLQLHEQPLCGRQHRGGCRAREALSADDPRRWRRVRLGPGRTRGYGVYGFLATDDGLWIGSDTDRIARWNYRGRIAFLPLAGGTELPADYAGTLPAQVVSLGLDQGGVGQRAGPHDQPGLHRQRYQQLLDHSRHLDLAATCVARS